MRIGFISNFWYVRGGLERVMLNDAQGLVARGHEVAPFASAHELNESSEYANLFPPNVEHGRLGEGLGLGGRARAAVRLFHNRAAAAAFDAFADRFRPNLVHQHGLSRQLSPSVLERAHRRGIPTVLTLHDFGLRCPSGDLSRADAPECLQLSCAGHRYDRAVRFRCVHGSRAASALAAAELLEARALRRYERAVDLFLVPSAYVEERMREAGLPADRLHIMPNAIAVSPHWVAPSAGKYIFAFGRLVAVKGFGLMIDLARALPELEFVIAGEGPERERLEERAAGLDNVSFTGFVSESEVTRLVRGAMVVVVPSDWPEPFGMVVLEAWREARPVIVTRRGALAEIVTDGKTGLVVEPGDLQSAEDALRRLTDEAGLSDRLGAAGHREAVTTYSMAPHLDLLEVTYRALMD